MKASVKDISRASIAVDDLSSLAALRNRLDISVSIVGKRAWIRWEPDAKDIDEILIRWILPLPGVELFTERDSELFRLGEHLPAFGVAVPDDRSALPVHRVMLPGPLSALRPEGCRPERTRVTLVPDERCRSHPATAVSCRLSALFAWADRSPSARFDGLRAAWTPGSDIYPRDALVVVIGRRGRLPAVHGGTRFWGTDVLVPLGFRTAPELSEGVLRNAAGARATDLIVLGPDGFEMIAWELFMPLDRAQVKLAWNTIQVDRAGWGGHE